MYLNLRNAHKPIRIAVNTNPVLSTSNFDIQWLTPDGPIVTTKCTNILGKTDLL
jgi:hypothetical protein